MQKLKQQQLFEKHKSLFALRIQDPSYPISFHGIQCDDGWFSIIDELMSKIDELNDSSIRVSQIKNKFGALRVYFSSNDSMPLSHIRSLVSDYELKSMTVCETCGASEAKRCTNQGWITPLCSTHSSEANSDKRSHT